MGAALERRERVPVKHLHQCFTHALSLLRDRLAAYNKAQIL